MYVDLSKHLTPRFLIEGSLPVIYLIISDDMIEKSLAIFSLALSLFFFDIPIQSIPI